MPLSRSLSRGVAYLDDVYEFSHNLVNEHGQTVGIGAVFQQPLHQ